MATVTNVQRTGWIGRDELQQNSWPVLRRPPAIVTAALQDGCNFGMECGRAEVEIDKSGAGNFDLVDEVAGGQAGNDCRRKFARILAGGLGQAQRDITGKIAMIRVTGSFDRRCQVEIPDSVSQFGQRRQGVSYKLCDDVFH